MEKKSKCSKCGVMMYDPFGMGKKIHDEEKCLGISTTDEGKCTCEQDTCKDDCKRNHTHKTFWCEKCRPEMCLATDEGKQNPPESWEVIAAETAVEAFKTRGYEAFSKLIYDGFKDVLTTETEKYKQSIKILEKEIDDMAKDWDKDLSTEKARWMKEWREKIEGKHRKLIESTDERTVWRQGYNQALDDIIKLTTPSEQEER